MALVRTANDSLDFYCHVVLFTAVMKAIRHFAYMVLWHGRANKNPSGDTAHIIQALRQHSYCHIPAFLDPRRVKAKLAAHTSDRKIYAVDASISSQRRAGVEKAIPEYVDHPLIAEVARQFYGEPVSVNKCTHEIKRPGTNPETGPIRDRGETTIFFHTDRPYSVLKTMLLLSDVTEDDGPFCIVAGSHRLSYGTPFQRMRRYMKITHKLSGSRSAHNIPHGREALYFDPDNIVPCTGKAGDLFFVDTGAFHRGPPLGPSGYREVVWNYLFNEYSLRRRLFERRDAA